MGKHLRPWVKIVLAISFLSLIILDISGSITGFFTKEVNTINSTIIREAGFLNYSFNLFLKEPA